MDIFISWSGEKSKAAAEALCEWIRNVIQTTRPFVSSGGIEKGARWQESLARALNSSFGILCLTPSNLHSEWIHFEAGALSKVQDSHVCTYLLGVDHAQVRPPLSMFQSTLAGRSETEQLVKSINNAMGAHSLSDDRVNAAFELWWPRLEEKLKTLPADLHGLPPRRTQEDMLSEILDLLRGQSRRSSVFRKSLGQGMAELVLRSQISRCLSELDLTFSSIAIVAGERSYLIRVIVQGGLIDFELGRPLGDPEATNLQLLGILGEWKSELNSPFK